MTGRPAIARDQPEHLVQVEQGGVCRREVPGDQDERGVRLGHARHRHAAQLGDDPLSHVAEVGGPLGHVAAERDELLLEGAERLEDSALAGGACVDAGVDVVGQHRVLRHLDRGLDDLPACAIGLPARACSSLAASVTADATAAFSAAASPPCFCSAGSGRGSGIVSTGPTATPRPTPTPRSSVAGCSIASSGELRSRVSLMRGVGRSLMARPRANLNTG